MADKISSGARRGEALGGSFGRRPTRMRFLVGISLLAWTFEIFLLITAGRVASLTHPPIEGYLAPLFHLVPWLAGLKWWRKVKRAERDGRIATNAADLCYDAIIGTVLSAYIILGYFETLLLPCILRH